MFYISNLEISGKLNRQQTAFYHLRNSSLDAMMHHFEKLSQVAPIYLFKRIRTKNHVNEIRYFARKLILLLQQTPNVIIYHVPNE